MTSNFKIPLMNNYFFSCKNEAKGKTNLILYYLILGYIVSLFIKDVPVITNILMGFIFLIALLTTAPKKYFKKLLNNKISFGMIIFYLYQIISVLLSKNISGGVSVLVLRLPLLLLPLAFCFITFDKKICDKILLFYAVVTTLASIVGFAYGIYKTIIEKDTGNLYNDNISEILGKQAVYFALYVGVALMIFIIRLKEYYSLLRKQNWFFYLAIAWLLFIIFMLASRTAMLGLLLVIIAYILKIIIDKRKIMEGLLFFFSILIGVVLISKMFPKTLNKFQGTTQINFQFENRNVENHFNAEYDPTFWNGTNTRLAIWKCAVDVWKKNPLLGTGLGDRNDLLMKQYEEQNFWYGLTTHKNTHNQYLDILMSMGVVGLLLFLIVFFIYPIKIFFKEGNVLALAIFFLLAMCFVTETMLERYQGLVFIAFFIPLCEKLRVEKIHNTEASI